MIYAMSDIHGCLEAFNEALKTVDLSDGDSKLILLGDYCDRGPDSLGVFRKIMALQQSYPEQVVALRGNHEEMLLEYCDMLSDPDFVRGWILADTELATAKSFLDADAFKKVLHMLKLKHFEDAYRFTVTHMKTEHADVLSWIRALPYYYETPTQVFVHAGIDEEAGDLWRVGTPEEFFTTMMPDNLGQHFDLDVIAGHITTESVSGIPGYQGIYHDDSSHYYIDGCAVKNGRVLVLRYNERTGKYSGPGLE